MTISPIGTTGTGTPSSAPAPTSDVSNLGSDAFLKLLVAQLKNQDPMNPAQGTEFLAQTAQFTMVEKLTQIQQQNADQLAAQRVLQAGQLVGRTVSYTDANGVAKQGTVESARLLVTGPVLSVDGTDVPMASVTEISQGPTAPSAAATPASGTTA